jgi:hypothetical protein
VNQVELVFCVGILGMPAASADAVSPSDPTTYHRAKATVLIERSAIVFGVRGLVTAFLVTLRSTHAEPKRRQAAALQSGTRRSRLNGDLRVD